MPPAAAGVELAVPLEELLDSDFPPPLELLELLEDELREDDSPFFLLEP